MADDRQLLKASYARVEDVADKVALSFYSRLFVQNPELRDKFPAVMDGQRTRFMTALLRISQWVDSPGRLDRYLADLGRDHRKFDIAPEHYPAFGHALIAALRDHAGTSWTPEVEAAWTELYAGIAARMLAGTGPDPGTPASWAASVVRRVRPTRDITLLTLEPDQPYPFRAGQYLSLETPHRPRLWRTYSIANAPRPDGRLDLHVRWVPRGWVSGALVCHTQPGDILRLGPPQGELVVEPESDHDLVLVAGGTGLAPFLAMIEDMARWNADRSVHLFYGARRVGELYALEHLRLLAARLPWLTVVDAVSDEPTEVGERGTVAEVAAHYADWTDQHDIYISGSPAMIRSTVAMLGPTVPAANIHYDPYGDG